MSYRVRMTTAAESALLDCAEFVAKRSESTEVALRWLDRVYGSIAKLDSLPRRHQLAEEDAYRDYEIRRLIVGNYLALYNIDEDAEVVHIIGFRHGARLPRSEELPDNPRE